MTAFAGSCERAAQAAALVCTQLDCTALETKVGIQVAIRGSVCWETDRNLRDRLTRSDGRPYHRESIARARRSLTRKGIIRAKRLFTGQKCAEMKYASPHGTTAKRFAWDRLGVANPFSRKQRAIATAMQDAERRKRRDRAQHSAPILPPNTAQPERPLELSLARLEQTDPQLAAELRTFTDGQARRQSTAPSTAPSSMPPSALERGPPSRD